MKKLKLILILMTTAALTACAPPKNAPKPVAKTGAQDKPTGQNEQKEQKTSGLSASITVLMVVDQENKRWIIKGEDRDEKRQGGISCRVAVSPGILPYEMGPGYMILHDGNNEIYLIQLSGNEGEVQGEWFVQEDNKGSVTYRTTYQITKNSLKMTQTCSRTTKTKESDEK